MAALTDMDIRSYGEEFRDGIDDSKKMGQARQDTTGVKGDRPNINPESLSPPYRS